MGFAESYFFPGIMLMKREKRKENGGSVSTWKKAGCGFFYLVSTPPKIIRRWSFVE